MRGLLVFLQCVIATHAVSHDRGRYEDQYEEGDAEVQDTGHTSMASLMTEEVAVGAAGEVMHVGRHEEGDMGVQDTGHTSMVVVSADGDVLHVRRQDEGRYGGANAGHTQMPSLVTEEVALGAAGAFMHVRRHEEGDMGIEHTSHTSMASLSPESNTPTSCKDTVPVEGSETPMPARGFITCCNKAFTDDDKLEGGLKHFISQGGRLIDTAPDYWQEATVGKVVSSSGVERSEFWISSKVDTDGWAKWCAQTAAPPLSLMECTVNKVKDTLSVMGLDYVDSMLLHFGPAEAGFQGSPFTPEQHVHMWEGLIQAKSQNLVRNIGVCLTSESEIQHLFKETAVMPAIVMTWLNPWMPDKQKDYVKWAQDEGIAVVIYDLFNFADMGKNGDAMKLKATAVGARHDATWGQVVLQWALDRGVSVVTSMMTAQDLPCLGFTVSPEDEQLLAKVDSVLCSFGRDVAHQLFPGCV